MNVFVEISVIIIVASAVSLVIKLLKQPFIVGYILTGILVGPYFLNILHSTEEIEVFSKIGITVLLFIVGLHLNPASLREVGKISLITGLGQVIFTSVIGYLICIALGLTPTEAIYAAIALTFSSTIIILKLLSDKGDLESLYGKISIGFLLVQDLVATIILIAITTFASTSGATNVPSILFMLLLKAALLGAILLLICRYVIPRAADFMASSPELLFLFSLSWGLGIAAVFYLAGFSVEVGALVAGIALSTTPFATEVGARMKPLRDFFILLFFILLGSQMVLTTILVTLGPALILSVFVLVGNPLIVFLLMNLLGYKTRTGFLAGLTVAQISEFSLILVSLGLSVGHVSAEILSLVTLVGIITIAGSTYLILYSDFLFSRLRPILNRIEIRKIKREKDIAGPEQHAILLFGYDRVGEDFVNAIKGLEEPYVVIDYNPKSIKRLKKESIPFMYGDAEDVEFLDEIGASRAKLIVSTIPDINVNKLLVQKIHAENKDTIIIVISHNIADTHTLYKLGATYVVMPHYLGAEFASQMIEKHGLEKAKFLKEQERHQKKLAKHTS